MVNKCNNCIHSNVCIFNKRYQDNYTTLKNKFKQEEPFSIELDCSEYKYNEPISYKNWTIYSTGINPSENKNTCEGCPIYEDMKKGINGVNDACSFCSKYPYKITTAAKC